MYSVDVDQSTAKQLVKEGGTLLLLGVPGGTVVGYDQQTHIVGPRFCGVKMLPPGPHIIAYSSVSSSGEHSPFTSFFVFLEARQVAIRKWEAEEELLLPLDDINEEAQLAEGVRNFDFDAGLAPWNLRGCTLWKSLSGHIDQAAIDRLSPEGSRNFSITAEAGPAASGSEAEKKLAEQLENSRLDIESQASTSDPSHSKGALAKRLVGRCRFTKVPRNVKSKGMTASELTLANLDKSGLLEEFIDSEFGGQPEGIAAELQFAFLAFLVGQSLEGFMQWKNLLTLLLSCERAPLQVFPGFYAKLLDALEAQLSFSLGQPGIPAGDQAPPLAVPMVDELLIGSFLKQLLSSFHANISSSDLPTPPELQVALDKLQKLVREQLDWDFRVSNLSAEASDDEYAPTVAEI